jgi:hypothetical protein
LEPSLVGTLVIDCGMVLPFLVRSRGMEVSDVLNLQVNTRLKLLCNIRTEQYIRNSRKNTKYRLARLGPRDRKVARRVELLHRFRNVLYVFLNVWLLRR